MIAEAVRLGFVSSALAVVATKRCVSGGHSLLGGRRARVSDDRWVTSGDGSSRHATPSSFVAGSTLANGNIQRRLVGSLVVGQARKRIGQLGWSNISPAHISSVSEFLFFSYFLDTAQIRKLTLFLAKSLFYSTEQFTLPNNIQIIF